MGENRPVITIHSTERCHPGKTGSFVVGYMHPPDVGGPVRKLLGQRLGCPRSGLR